MRLRLTLAIIAAYAVAFVLAFALYRVLDPPWPIAGMLGLLIGVACLSVAIRIVEVDK